MVVGAVRLGVRGGRASAWLLVFVFVPRLLFILAKTHFLHVRSVRSFLCITNAHFLGVCAWSRLSREASLHVFYRLAAMVLVQLPAQIAQEYAFSVAKCECCQVFQQIQTDWATFCAFLYRNFHPKIKILLSYMVLQNTTETSLRTPVWEYQTTFWKLICLFEWNFEKKKI